VEAFETDLLTDTDLLADFEATLPLFGADLTGFLETDLFLFPSTGILNFIIYSVLVRQLLLKGNFNSNILKLYKIKPQPTSQ
jgi:hypothetical protein